MKNCFVVVCSVAVLFSASGVMAAGSGVLSEITTCYQKAGENMEQINHCLNEEYEAVVAEYKDVTERVAVIAKSWDKPNRNRVRWDKLMKANQAFKGYVGRECDFVENTTRGARILEKNAEMACKINLYRMRVDFLENRYLSAEKE